MPSNFMPKSHKKGLLRGSVKKWSCFGDRPLRSSKLHLTLRWSHFSLAQRRIASRERGKVILIWGQTRCWNLLIFKIPTFFHVRDRIASRERKPHHFFGGNRDFSPTKKSCHIPRHTRRFFWEIRTFMCLKCCSQIGMFINKILIYHPYKIA